LELIHKNLCFVGNTPTINTRHWLTLIRHGFYNLRIAVRVHYIIWRDSLHKAPKGAFIHFDSEKSRLMDRHAIFIDAGDFFAAGVQAAFGNSTPRKQIALKSPGAMRDDFAPTPRK
jgi:hypothetical protein